MSKEGQYFRFLRYLNKKCHTVGRNIKIKKILIKLWGKINKLLLRKVKFKTDYFPILLPS
jgi:hypothetical protein